jgi:hypothetical protein
MAFQAPRLDTSGASCGRDVRCGLRYDGGDRLQHGQAQGVDSALVRRAGRLVERIVKVEPHGTQNRRYEFLVLSRQTRE